MAAEAHSHEHIHRGEHDHDHGALDVAEAPVRKIYAPARMTALGIAVFFAIVGGIGLSRTGFDMDQLRDANLLRDETTQVFGLGTTQLTALIHLGIALLALIGVAGRALSRVVTMLLGPLMLAAGIAVIIQPDIVGDWLAMNRVNGVAYLVAGGVATAMAIGTPITWTRRGYRHRRHAPAM